MFRQSESPLQKQINEDEPNKELSLDYTKQDLTKILD